MPGATDLERDLSTLGLTRDETRAYLALLERGRLTAREASSATGITRGRIYDVLGGLANKGAAVEAIARPRKFQAAPPAAIVANLLERRKAELEQIERASADLVESLDARAEIGGNSPTFIESVHHKATLSRRLEALVSGAREEILTFVRTPFLAGLEASDLQPQFDALRRGVKMRAIYESQLLERDDVMALAQRLAGAGEESRHAEQLPTKLLVVDRSTTLLPLPEAMSPDDATTLIVAHVGLSNLTTAAFEHSWSRSAPIPLREGWTRGSAGS